MGGKEIVKIKLYRLHGNLCILISQEKVEQQPQRVVCYFHSLFRAECTDTVVPRSEGPRPRWAREAARID